MKGGTHQVPTRKKRTCFKPMPRKWLLDLRGELSQAKVAYGIGMEQGTYNQIEAGKQGFHMNAPRLLALSKVLQVSLEEICIKESDYLYDLAKLNPGWYDGIFNFYEKAKKEK